MSLPREGPGEEALWSAALAGSVDAWSELFVRHHRAIYNFCFRRTGSWPVAEDLSSAVFMEAWRRRGEVRPEVQTALPWLYGIATMLARNHQRATRRYREALARIPPPEPDRDPAELVAARVDAQKRVRALDSALGRLSRRDREVLDLAATGRLSHAEIGAALGLPVGTVKSRLSRARRRLGEHLDFASAHPDDSVDSRPANGASSTDVAGITSVKGGSDGHRDVVSAGSADAARAVRGASPRPDA